MTQCSRCITFLSLLLATWLLFPVQSSGQGVHVFADGEVSIFNELALGADAGAAWSTDRSSTPGYFSAIADATYSGAARVWRPMFLYMFSGYLDIRSYKGDI